MSLAELLDSYGYVALVVGIFAAIAVVGTILWCVHFRRQRHLATVARRGTVF